ncbi:MAG: MFS family permease [Polaribacter sp.]|jgi:MFS family permease
MVTTFLVRFQNKIEMIAFLACRILKVLQGSMARKNLSLLATCQGLMMSCTSLTIATSALVGVLLAPTPVLATLPLGLTYGCMMLMMIPASLFMRRYGRRAGFVLGGCAGMIGGTTSAVGIYTSSFLLFCIGSIIFGVASGFGQYYRFAATEVVDESYKSRAISWVLLGGLVAAFIGPNAASLTRDLIPDALFSASYALVALFSLCIVVTQYFIRIPSPSAEESSGHKRPLRQILTRSTFIVAALCAMVAYGTMNLLMTVTPLAMHDREMAFGATVLVIQWHIVGMFAPSFFTGSLIDRFGVLKITLAGALILVACAAVALSGQLYSHFVIGLVMLGIGWNFLYIGGTTLLTESYLPAEKGAVQGINEFLVFSATTLTAFTSGYLHYKYGWETLNQYAIPVVCVTACIIIWFGWSRYRNQQAQLA